MATATVGYLSRRLRHPTWMAGALCPHASVTLALGPATETPPWPVLEQIALAELRRSCPACPGLAELYAYVLHTERMN